MLAINSKVLNRLLRQICRVLDLKGTSSQSVTVSSDGQRTSVYTCTKTCAAQCSLDLATNPLSLCLPMNLLIGLPSSNRHDIKFRMRGRLVQIEFWQAEQWHQLNVKQGMPCARPGSPALMLAAGTDFGRTIFQAALLAEANSTRHAMGYIRLRGRDGQIAVTDSREAFVRCGFVLPLDEIIVPAAAVARLQPLSKYDPSVTVGIHNNWLELQFQAGLISWKVNICVDTSSSFSMIDRCFDPQATCRTTVKLPQLQLSRR